VFRVEYLFIFKKDAKLDSNRESVLFNLKRNKRINFISDTTLIFNTMNISLVTNSVRNEENGSHKSCKFVFTNDDTNEDIQGAINFLSFVTEVTASLQEINNESIKILDNSAAAFVAAESYKLINNIENKMRKLITLFMTSNVGADWEMKHTPENVEGSVKNKDKLLEDKTSNILYYVNFIDLSAFLFKGYKTMSTEELHRRLSSGDIRIEEIQERYNLKSNWERYFQGRIDVNDQFINEKWKALYELRNKIAHNRSLSADEYNKIKGISNNLGKIIEDAVQNINEIVLTDSQIQEVTSVVDKEIKEARLSTQVSEIDNGFIRFFIGDESSKDFLNDVYRNNLKVLYGISTGDNDLSKVKPEVTGGSEINNLLVELKSRHDSSSAGELKLIKTKPPKKR